MRQPSDIIGYQRIMMLENAAAEKAFEMIDPDHGSHFNREQVEAAIEYLRRWEPTAKHYERVRKRHVQMGNEYRVGDYILSYDKFAPFVCLTKILRRT